MGAVIPMRIFSQIALRDGCWVWVGPRDEKGYGIVWFRGRRDRAHRVLWILLRGEIPRRRPHLDHRCRNTSCADPWHLEPVTNRENQRRRRREVCLRGHALRGRNVLVFRGKRHGCRRCSNERQRLKGAA